MRRGLVWRVAALVGVVAVLAGCSVTPGKPRAQASPRVSGSPIASVPVPVVIAPGRVVVPRGVTAGIAVYDRDTGAFVQQIHSRTRFRSASLVKLLIALDYLWNRGPAYQIPAADLPKFQVMLRSSDDDAASYFWNRAGTESVVTRMVSRLKLRDTRPPSAVGKSGWGSTTLSAEDIVAIYRYLLDTAPAPVRDAVLSNLRASTQCGTDDYDQSFGIPSAFGKPWAVKQGWYGFGDSPEDPCAPRTGQLRPPPPGPAITGTAPTAVLSGAVLHTTGIVGPGDRAIVVVLSQYPPGTSYADAVATITHLAWSLPVPGGVPVAAS